MVVSKMGQYGLQKAREISGVKEARRILEEME
jgi:hypothetical protein